MLPLQEVKQEDNILVLGDMELLINPVDYLPDPNSVPLNRVVIRKFLAHDGTRSHFYLCREDEAGERYWEDITYTEWGYLEPPSELYVTRIAGPNTDATAQVALTFNWKDPHSWYFDKNKNGADVTETDDVRNSAILAKTVLVRKFGSYPTSPNDGVTIASSSVKDQYLYGNDMGRRLVDSIPGYTIGKDTPDVMRFFYALFCITRYGRVSYLKFDPRADDPEAEGEKGRVQEESDPQA